LQLFERHKFFLGEGRGGGRGGDGERGREGKIFTLDFWA